MYTSLPPYFAFREICENGLSTVRPLNRERAKDRDRHGWNYGSAALPSYEAFGRMRALFALDLARKLRPRRVLEVAAGDAALCASLQDSLGCEVWANDLRADQLEDSIRSFTNCSSIGRLPGNLFDLDPKITGLFDLVVACEVIEHVAHTAEFLKQLRRFLTPNGKLLLTTPNGAYFRNKLPTHSQIQDFAALESRQFKPDADGHLFLITPEELHALAESAGLRVERLDLWGTPALTGQCGTRIASRLGKIWPWYALETTLLKLPMPLRQKLCYALSTVLTPL
ncbi:MAG TPA: class I SAM-dependent methyltransferase [Bryobacteraceae bacterium]|nr:class I SAM-dependent methyltransferase [Bryobacteraceae bacterium]